MSAGPGLLAAALAFWGWQAGQPAAAAVLAVLVAASLAVRGRLDLSRENQHRLADLCAALFAGAAALTYATTPAQDAARVLLVRTPLFFAPLLLAQVYGARGTLDAGAFFWSLRRDAAGASRWPVDATAPFVGLCLLSASATNGRSPAFYPAAALVAAWAVWTGRPRRTPAWLTAAFAVPALAAGHAGHIALARLQPAVERRALELAYDLWKPGSKDPGRSRTAIGSVGELKRSQKVVLRVVPLGPYPPPPLLRNAVYDVYKDRDWLAGGRFEDLPAADGDLAWSLGPEGGPARGARLEEPVADGRGLLALPAGTVRVAGLPAVALKRSRLGAVMAEGSPEVVEFEAWSAGEEAGTPPSPADLAVPEGLRAVFARTARELGLRREDPAAAAAAVKSFFERRFEYSLDQGPTPRGVDPLEDFMLRTRRGHCEHFATAAVLTLRAAGVPARYATGFSVQEYSRLERLWVVRRRHAHAWAQYRDGGAWKDLDATPSSWAELEAAEAPAWLPASDALSWLAAAARRARRGPLAGRAAMWGLAAVAAYLAWRLRGGIGRLRLGAGAGPARGAFPGADSELYALEAALAARGLGRRPEETVVAWARRVGDPGGRLLAAARLHERLRFDPRGLDAGERADLRSAAEALIGWRG